MSWQARFKRSLANFDLSSPIILLIGLIIDLLSKRLVSSGKINSYGGNFELLPRFNTTFMGGLFTDANEWIVQIFFTVISVFLFMFSAVFFFVLRRQDVPRLKYGFILLSTGFFGNVLDRVLYGRVTDIFIWKVSSTTVTTFNFADIFAIIGSILVLVSLVLDHKTIFHRYNIKRKLLIEPKFQIEFSLILVFFGLLNASMIGIYSYSYLRVYLSQAGYVVIGVQELLRDYIVGLAIMEFFFLLASFAIGIVFSHKMIGPIQAFEGFVNRLLANRPEPRDTQFRLRQLDYFKNLERIAANLKAKWAEKNGPSDPSNNG